MKGLVKNFNAQCWAFNVKNRFPELFMDKHHVSGTMTNFFDLKSISTEDFKKAILQDPFLKIIEPITSAENS